ncbi:MAG: hypothetical protein Q7U18_13470 [Methylobacter sp.]|nr:hypothetical protein [Methylobacter sp.]
MNLKKRGLGRGLEALLADDSAKKETHPPQTKPSADNRSVNDEMQSKPEIIEAMDERAGMVVALFKNIQREKLVLQEEAEALKKMIEEFESILRADQS